MKRRKKFIRYGEDRWINESTLPEMWWLSRCPKLAGVMMLTWRHTGTVASKPTRPQRRQDGNVDTEDEDEVRGEGRG